MKLNSPVIKLPTSKLCPDFEQARRFLSFLDPSESSFTFQTFDDNASARNAALVKVFHGPFSSVESQLTTLNRNGAGVFVTVNKTDLTGRKKENIIGIRAVWIEDDTGTSFKPPVTPHITVESSPSKYHHYFLLADATQQDFYQIQNALVDNCDSDPNAKDLSRVLRLPGFYHQKIDPQKGLNGKPFLVKMVGGLLL